MTPKVVIHTDGACSGQSGAGRLGGGAAVRRPRAGADGGELATTNNRMELMAAIRALEALKRPCKVELHTDSQYVMKGISGVDPRLEAARLDDRRQEAGEERRPLAAPRRSAPAP